MFYRLDPEVAGLLGPRTVMDRSTHPPVVHALHYVFDGWPADDLITSFPCFLVTHRMQELITSARATGCHFEGAETTISDQFEDLYPGKEPPSFSWLIIDGVAERDDIGKSVKGSLVVSDRLLEVMKRGRLDYCDVDEVRAH